MDGQTLEPIMNTGVKYGFELDEILEFPLKIKDLAPRTMLSIAIFNMDRSLDDDLQLKPIASTVLDVFDCHKRLRQGTWNLELYLDQLPDTSLKSKTPGLTSHSTTYELNNTLR